LSLARSLGACGEAVSRIPETVSCSPQGKGKEGNDNSGERGHGAVVLTGGEARTSDVQFTPNDRFDDEAAFVLKGLVGLMTLAIVYAILKRF